ncbi:MAG: thiamine phosphate synthase [Geminicoccaceae bacterium]
MRRNFDLRLYGVLDPTRCRDRDPVTMAEQAAEGGVTLVQYRTKARPSSETVDQVSAIRRVLERAGVPLIVNDNVDLAIEAGAAGVHLGQNDKNPGAARELLGENAIIGVTCHAPYPLEQTLAGDIDYAGLGPVFATSSKDPGDPPLGADGLRDLVGRVRGHKPGLPVCAIAGIDQTNAATVIGSGADGIAVIASLFLANDVATAAKDLRAIVDRTLTERQKS